MNIEEKAQAYDEALKQAKFYYGNCPSEPERKKLEGMFPELKESEDERIRKGLIELIENWNYPQELFTTKRNIIGYLEKQKEQKSTIERLRDISTPADENWFEIQKKWEKEDEQKPAKCIPDSIKFDEGFKTGREVGFREGAESVKPVEWSDDIIRKAVKEVGLTQHQINWFKTNVFPPKQEWSDEDKDAINGAIGILLDDNNPNFVFPEHSKLSVGEIVKRLKSLRPSWKPSEEQMKALESCFCEFGEGCPDEDGLRSLYNDLKKLM